MASLLEGIDREKIAHDGQDFSNKILNAKCHNCEKEVTLIIVATATPFDLSIGGSSVPVEWYWCPHCGSPSSSINGMFLPSPKEGRIIKGLPCEIQEIYDEIRNVTGVNAYRASDMLCRKVLMHIAVTEGADEGKSFLFYVNYLVEKKIISERMKKWVDKIREYGNEQVHEIKELDEESSKKTLQFTIQLLVTIYEMIYLMDSGD